LDEILTKRESINKKLTDILDHGTEEWGIRVLTVEIKDVMLPQNMQRAMGSQAEAERERRAKVISAEGELQSSTHLLEAANTMTQNTATMPLRYLQTLTQISTEKPSTIIFPLPIPMSQLSQGMWGSQAQSSGDRKYMGPPPTSAYQSSSYPLPTVIHGTIPSLVAPLPSAPGGEPGYGRPAEGPSTHGMTS